ncbi:MAG: DUF393 domain-containing protein [Halomonadaceae bacterium]|nr:MAG: DUF393 domain-containing protein [Halomonadaceae bacterium]
MDTLFYDGQCPLCQREMRTLERLRRDSLQLQDIHALSPDPHRPPNEDLLYLLHLQTGAGDWVIGLPANVRAWSHTRFGWLFRPLLWPGLRQVAEAVYFRWAKQRYRKRYGCIPCGQPRKDHQG